MSILSVVAVLVIAGLVMYLINNYIPMESRIKSLLNIVVIIVLIIWLLKVFGLIGSLKSFKI